jgi:hypothetical protein
VYLQYNDLKAGMILIDTSDIGYTFNRKIIFVHEVRKNAVLFDEFNFGNHRGYVSRESYMTRDQWCDHEWLEKEIERKKNNWLYKDENVRENFYVYETKMKVPSSEDKQLIFRYLLKNGYTMSEKKAPLRAIDSEGNFIKK